MRAQQAPGMLPACCQRNKCRRQWPVKRRYSEIDVRSAEQLADQAVSAARSTSKLSSAFSAKNGSGNIPRRPIQKSPNRRSTVVGECRRDVARVGAADRLRRAEECVSLAETTSDPKLKQEYLKLAGNPARIVRILREPDRE